MPQFAARAACVCLALGLAAPVSAQGAFQTLDPFYGGETAARSFFGEFALSGEVGYNDSDLIGPSDAGTPAGNLSLSGRLDYALLPQVDLSLVADLSGGVGRGPLGVSWVVVKPYWHNDLTDYAVRVAVDPASEGGLGFRRTDVAFLSSSTLGPTVTTDFAIGLRRVRTGYTETDVLNENGIDTSLPVVFSDPDGPVASSIRVASASDRIRVVGQELHGSWGYNVLFDPAGSRVMFGLVAEAGDYRLVSANSFTNVDSEEDGEESTDRIRSGTGWARMGIEFSRPSYQLSPYISVPMVTWADDRGEVRSFGPRPEKARLGLRLTLR
ncbi:MAG: hypothetical protein Rubg2KO_30700 [Rubricoccaceae bacterium]